MSQSQEMHQLMSHQMLQSPIMQTQGVELFSYFMRESSKGTTDLDEDAVSVLEQLAKERFVVIGAFGPNGSGKGGLLKGFKRIIQQDERLKRHFSRKKIQLDIQTYPFSLSVFAAKLPNTPNEFRLPDFITPGTLRFEDTMKASCYQSHLIKKYALPRRENEHLATAVLIEGSTPLAVPEVDKHSFTMSGKQNLGLSTLVELALDPDISRFLRIYATERNDKDATDEAIGIREKIHKHFDPSRTFASIGRHSDQFVLSVGRGQEIEVSKLPRVIQREIRDFVLKTQAPPDAIDRSTKELDEFKKELQGMGLLNTIDDNTELFNLIADRMGLRGSDRFSILRTQFTLGTKIDDLSYFTESVFAKNNPELLVPLDLAEAQKIGRSLLYWERRNKNAA